MQTNTENNTSETTNTLHQVPLTAEPLKPRSEWDEDERLDGRPKTDSIHVLVIRPGAEPSPQIIGNNLDAIQAVVGGLFTTFDTGIEGVIGVANDEALVDNLPLNRIVPATGAGLSRGRRHQFPLAHPRANRGMQRSLLRTYPRSGGD